MEIYQKKPRSQETRSRHKNKSHFHMLVMKTGKQILKQYHVQPLKKRSPGPNKTHTGCVGVQGVKHWGEISQL